MSTTCRRCGKPLTAPLAVAARVGARCALLEFAAAAAEGRTATVADVEPTPAQSAVALIAAFFHGQDDQIGPLMLEADMRDVAGLLAAFAALFLEDQPDGAERLRRAGLRVAEARL